MKILFVSHSAVLKYHQQKLVILAEKYNLDITLCTPPFWYEGGIYTEASHENKSIKYIIGDVFFIKKRMFHLYKNADKIIKHVRIDLFSNGIYRKYEETDFGWYNHFKNKIKLELIL